MQCWVFKENIQTYGKKKMKFLTMSRVLCILTEQNCKQVSHQTDHVNYLFLFTPPEGWICEMSCIGVWLSVFTPH